ncbi:MAG: choice-of-anchor D domain-containing protein [bacterium]
MRRVFNVTAGFVVFLIVFMTTNPGYTAEPENADKLEGITLAEPGVVYGTTGHVDGGNLLRIDPATGAATVIGATGLSAVPGLAIDSNGRIFGAEASTGKLYRIDAATGAATFATNPGLSFLDGIAFDKNDNLYGVDVNRDLYKINPTTGAATLIGNTGENISGLAFDPTTGTLWASAGGWNAVVKDGIYTINKNTGAATLVGKTGLGGGTPDLLCDKYGNLWAVKGGGRGPNKLIRINKSTGAGTVIGSTGVPSVSGLAFGLIPDMSVTPLDHDYGEVEVGSSSSYTFKIKNNGTADLHVSSVSVSGPYAAEFSEHIDAMTLSWGQSRDVVVEFTPTSVGDKYATLRVTSDDPDQDPVDVSLTGIGIAPDIHGSPSSSDFGVVRVGLSSSQMIKIMNIGTADLYVTSMGLAGIDAGDFSIVSGDGSVRLAPGWIRNVVVKFMPTSDGPKSATLQISSNDPDENPFAVLLTGTAVAPYISVNPPAFNYDDVMVGSNVSQTFEVTNNGPADLVVSSTTLLGPGSEDFLIASGGGAFTLGPGESRSVVVSFNPSNAGLGKTSAPLSQRVTVGQQALYTFDEGAGTTVNDVSGVGLPLHLIMADSTATSWIDGGLSITSETSLFSFAAATKLIDAMQSSHSVTIEAWVQALNTTQSGPARIVTLSVEAASRNFTLAQNGDAYDIRLRTTDTDDNGKPSIASSPGTLTTQLAHVIYTRDASGQVKLYIDGVEQVSATVGGDFSNWSQMDRFGLANEFTGARAWLGDFHLVAVYNRALDPAEVQQNFAAGPTGVGSSAGQKSASLLISSNDPVDDEYYVSLTGNAVEAPVPDIAVDPTSYHYGDVGVGSSADQALVVSNTGTSDLVVSSVSLIGADAAEFSINSGGGAFTLAPGASQNIMVGFNPSSSGSKSAALRINNNDPDEAPLDVTVSGNGVAAGGPDIAVDPTAYDYGDVGVGSSATQTFAVSNTGTSDLDVSSVSLTGTDAAEFSIESGGGAFTLAPGASQDIVVAFNPSSPGTKSAALRINNNDPDEAPKDVLLTSNAVTTLLPDIAVDPTNYDFGIMNLEDEGVHTFTIRNEGAAVMEVVSITIVGTDADQFWTDDGGTPFNLNAGESRELNVSFKPTATGQKTALLRIECNDADENPFDVLLSGYVNAAPSVPQLLYPAYEDTASMLIWASSNDPDTGDLVTYTLEILSQQPTFTMETSDTSVSINTIAQSFNFVDGSFYFWRVKAVDNHGGDSDFSAIGKFKYVELNPTGIDDPSNPELPTEFTLTQNYPNPFNPTTQIRYELPVTAVVTLRIYDVMGNEIRRLLNQEHKNRGVYSVTWDGRDNRGNIVASGVYFYNIKIQPRNGGKPFVQTKKMTMLK